MTRAQELISLFSEFTDEMGVIISQIEDINSRLAAIDLNASDAEILVQNLLDERESLVDRVNGGYNVEFNKALALYRASSAAVQAQVTPTLSTARLAWNNGTTLAKQVKNDLSAALATAKSNAQTNATASLGNQSDVAPDQARERAAFLEANQAGDTAPSEDYMAELRAAGLTKEEISGTPPNTTRGIPSAKTSANQKATRQDNTNFRGQHDWRVRLSLAKDARYLYKAKNPGILSPLYDTDGIIFPYMPAISVNYSAGYDGQELTHSNYKVFQYRSSGVDGLTINCDFTAQDTNEAAYLLAVIHFLRSVTKMFYGQDQNPRNGTPPPLCYLHGLGQFQFNNHPLVINTFTYSLPNDVDYVRCDSEKFIVGSNGNAIEQRYPPSPNSARKYENDNAQQSRNAPAGGEAAAPNFKNANYNVQPTYVPSKMSIIIQAHPIITRDSISNKFSVKDYATGDLYRGTNNNSIGVW